MTEPLLGSFGVVRTNGFAAWAIRAVTQSTCNHAFVYVGNGQIVEAEPSGARLANMDEYTQQVTWSTMTLDERHRHAIAAAAVSLIGTPYSWVDCAAIGITKLLGHHIPPAVRQRLNRRDRLMCSQLVDTAYNTAGIQLFADGRYPGDVSPGDLLDLINGG